VSRFSLGCISRPLSDGSVVCIADRGKITDSSRYGWFTVFAIIFEVTSAYANVGFSLGVPYVRNPFATFTLPSLMLSVDQSDASFATSLSTVSKLVLMAAMIRGRTRELPIAIDRAVLTPHQLQQHGDPVEHEDGDRGETAANEAEESGQHAAS
jgi:Trk-type K+ transport system membrane component